MSPFSPTRWIALPLLSKELLEQSARARTYILRVVYAILLFVGAYLLSYDVLNTGNGNVWSLMGKGKDLFERLLGLQFFGVYLFMPAITCGVLTHEKERDSLMLLLLTKLDPWSIVLEKLLSRVVLMSGFLMLSLPLMALAYSLGGITLDYMFGGVFYLILAMLQAGTLAIACSAYFRTTVGAFMASYIIGFGGLFGPVFLVFLSSLLFLGTDGPPQFFNWPFMSFLQQLGIIDHPEQLMLPFFAPAQILTSTIGRPFDLKFALLRSLPLIGWCWFCLCRAEGCLLSRAAVAPYNPLLSFWRVVDRLFHRLNQNRVTRGVVLVRDEGGLPEKNPVAWRETTKRSLGRMRYLLRLLIVVETLVLALLFSNAVVGGDRFLPMAAVAYTLLWILIALLVTVSASTLVSGERSHQTLDVLCVTPLSSRDILVQKFTSTERVILALSIPLLSVIGFEIFWRSQFSSGFGFGQGSEVSVVLYAVSSLITAVMYPRALAWLTMYVGLMMGTRVKAMMASLVVVTLWCLGPQLFIVAPLSTITPNYEHSPLGWLAFLSPMTMLIYTYGGRLDRFNGAPWLAVAVNAVLVGAVWLLFRTLCLERAAHWLGRSEVTTLRSRPDRKLPEGGGSPPVSGIESKSASEVAATPLTA